MPASPRTSSRVCTLGLLLAVAACEPTESADEDLEVTSVRQAALVQTGAGGAGGAPVTETLATYAAKCEAATGIHVPKIDCTAGTEVPQGTSFDPVEATVPIPSGAGGGSVGPPAPVQPAPPAVLIPPTSLVRTITAKGAGITGTQDGFVYSYQTHNSTAFRQPSGTAEVYLSTFSGGETLAKAGVMFRDSLAKEGRNVMIGINGQGSAVLQSRTTVSGQTTANAVKAGWSAPVWLKLEWDVTGDAQLNQVVRVVGLVSKDHSSWTTVGDFQFTTTPKPDFPAVGHIGLAVTAATTSSPPAVATATFDKFTTTETCDTPNVLNGQCDPRSKFQVVAQTADAIVVVNCRKAGAIDDKVFKDMAVIQYSAQNGALCFYQSPLGSTDGNNLTPPLAGTGPGLFPWETPEATHDVGCTTCHDNGPFVRSPYLYQLSNFPKEPIYANKWNKLRYVGLAFKNDKSWYVGGSPNDEVLRATGDSGPMCSSCHKLSVSNVGRADGGSGLKFAMEATAETDRSKNPNSTASPIWMRPYDANIPGSGAYSEPAWLTAKGFQDCAAAWSGVGFKPSPQFPSWCSVTANGVAYTPPIASTTDWNINTSGGSATGTMQAATLISPKGTDVYDVSDKFFWTYASKLGDGRAVAKVTRLDPSDPYAKAGIMIRDGIGPNAVNVMIALTSAHGPTFQWRPAGSAQTVTQYLNSNVSVPTPVWLRLDRTGTTFVGAMSTNNGDSWTQIGTPVTLPTFATPNVGLVATSHTDPATGSTGRADFQSFDWTDSSGWDAVGSPHVFVDANIGASTGSRVENKIVETMTANGGDIFGTSDQFRYAFKTFSGSGMAVTKVVSQTATPTLDPYAKAGLMIRNNSDANAANVFVGKTPSGVTFQSRTAAGVNTTVVNVNGPVQATWFRLIKLGNVFIGQTSIDKVRWSPVGDPAIFSSFTPAPLAGLALSSKVANTTTTGIFDSTTVPLPSSDWLTLQPGMEWTSSVPTWVDASFGINGASRVTTGSGATRTETITAAGADIYGSTDQFLFNFTSLPATGTITAKVESIVPAVAGQTVDPYAKAGVMIRDTLTGSSANALAAITYGNGWSFQYRPSNAGTVPTPVFGTATAPYWVRLQRLAGNQVKAYVSSNGTSWGSAVGTYTFAANAMSAGAVQVGLAVTSHNANQSVKATFSNITVTSP